jgi:hypothetical protein
MKAFGRCQKKKRLAHHVGLGHLAPASLDADGRPRGECGEKAKEWLQYQRGVRGVDLGLLPNTYYSRFSAALKVVVSPGRNFVLGNRMLCRRSARNRVP